MPINTFARRYVAKEPALALLVALTAAATLASVAAVGALSSQAFSELTSAARRTVEFETYHGRVVHGREIMTHTARMAAFTGEIDWLKRHEDGRLELNAALSAATALTADRDARRAAAATQVANEALLGSERIAGHFVRSGQLDRAQDTLTDAYYAEQTSVFDQSMNAYFDAVDRALSTSLARAETRLELALCAAVIAILGSAALWAIVLAQVARQRTQITRAKAALEDAHVQLARTAERREASLFDDSPVAHAERDLSAVARLVRRLRAEGIDDLDAWIDANPDVVEETRQATVLSRLNQAFADLVGGTDVDALMRADRYRTADAYRGVFLNDLRACWRGEQLWVQEADLYRLDGERRQTLGFARPQRGSESSWDRVLLTVVDVSDLKRAEAALSEALVHAQAANRAKSEFLAVMSHEIRTPMNGVLGMAAALERTELDQRQRDMLGVITASGDTLLQILNDLLDISKIEAGRLELETTTFELGALLSGANALFGPRAVEKGLDFKIEITPEASGYYLGDPNRIRQVVYNLLSNAVKFTERGSICVRVNVEPRGCDPDDGGETFLSFEVADTGVGIDPEIVSSLFEPFHQADASTSRRFGGTGLGLSIAKRLVEMMGGEIAVDSEPGRRSTFRFRVRVDAWADDRLGRPEPIEPEAAGRADDDRALRVLAAEDNPHNRMVLKALLDPAGASTTFAENGREAFELWRDGDFDIILMDIQMPEVDGVEATRMIREAETETRRPRTPIVAVTANAMAHQIERYLAAGMDAHVAKPIKPDDLFSVVLTSLAVAEQDVFTLAESAA